MATAIEHSPFHDRRTSERRRVTAYAPALRGEGVRVSWGGVWGGVLVALGVLLLSGALGVAVGASAAATRSAQALGAGAAAWTTVTLLIALFLGGMVATRAGATYDRTTSVVEGVLVWVVIVILGAAFAGSGLMQLALYGGLDQLMPRSAAGSAAWIAFGGLVLSLLAAVLGAAVGRRRYPASTGT